MVLVTMGTQAIKCDRIINAVIGANIKDNIIVQGFYKPGKKYKNIKFVDFIPFDEMQDLINRADIIVASGTGSIIGALLMGKKVIIFPRLGRYGEAIDDHVLDMKILQKKGYAEFVEEAKDFTKVYERCKNTKYKKFISNTNNFIRALEEEIFNM